MMLGVLVHASLTAKTTVYREPYRTLPIFTFTVATFSGLAGRERVRPLTEGAQRVKTEASI